MSLQQQPITTIGQPAAAGQQMHSCGQLQEKKGKRKFKRTNRRVRGRRVLGLYFTGQFNKSKSELTHFLFSDSAIILTSTLPFGYLLGHFHFKGCIDDL